MEETKHIKVSINTGSLQGCYLIEIQNLLDVITFVYAAADTVTEDRYQGQLGFMSFLPANDRRLSYGEARKQSTQWLLTSFLTASVNATGNFLDECRKVCALYRLAGKGNVVRQEFNDIFEREWKQFHRLGFPDKFDQLQREFGVEAPFQKHFLSLNHARNCLVHRKGIVAPQDTNEEGRLTVIWRIVELVAKSPGGEEEIVIEGPTQFEAGASISVRFTDRQRSFDVGQRIELAMPELYHSISTLFAFASSLVQSIQSYGATQGVGKTKS